MSIGKKIILTIERFLNSSAKSKDMDTPRVYISDEILNNTTRLLRSYKDRKEDHEGIVYWAGRCTERDWFITTCIAPKAQTSWGSFSTNVKANAEVISCISKYGLQLLAQVHSHPGKKVDHSDGDDKNAFMPYEGFISIVVPEYGIKGMEPLHICGIHRFEMRRFRRLSDIEVRNNFMIAPLSQDMRGADLRKGIYV